MSRAPEHTRPDLYSRVTAQIIEDLQRGVRPWTKPWSAEHLAGRITRPLRHCGQPYSGINVVLLWADAVAKGFSAPIWMTFRQALELGAHVRKGERGSTVVYANRLRRTEIGDDGRDVEREIPFLKAYTVFNGAP
ncbi:ArdC-like ssDNA-binding domain-containing protein [Phenylobacterium zucineum]|uniref:ArdC-like ssDNA-binding domain-containing protein n=1 Tax=Phenylobacterium zucineum TaxID=284016 RepID=UPI0002F5F56B|nr:ArdC-like ssDNA-binding domain-containing protein [Phenylobacterium zucineum]